jgi:23S rRNA (pseudouridine1915-N3)-methyltransferase
MHIKIVWVGRTKSEALRSLTNDYLHRLTKFVRCEVVEVRESAASADEGIKNEEATRILNVLSQNATVIVLDVEGRQWSSHELAGQIEKWQNASEREIAFVIGGHLGIARIVRERAFHLWSLSRLTFTHEMARVVLIEQLYRAYTITRGVPYQK